MSADETTRLHRCAKCGEERSAVESCEGDCYPLCGPCHLELRHEDAAVWRARVDAAERERDDLAAVLETRTAEHALAVARVAELEAILAGRTTPPTDEEIYAHEVAGGMWVATPARKTISGRSWSCAMSTAYEVRRFLVSPGDRWIPLDAAGRPCAWPTAEVSRG